MCWFHLKMNIKKHKNIIPQTKYISIMRAITALHIWTCPASYKLLLRFTFGSWKKGLNKFTNYCEKQWINS